MTNSTDWRCLCLRLMEFFVQQITAAADQQCDGKYDSCRQQLSAAKGISAHGGSDNGRKAAEAGDQQPVGKLDRCQSGSIAEYIFWCTRQQKSQYHKQGDPALVLQKPE